MPAAEASETIVIDASRDAVVSALLDIESQPSWARSVKDVQVLERDDRGRAARARLTAAALGLRIHYTLAYDYSRLPDMYSWTLVEGSLRAVDGHYRFHPEDGERTQVTYHLRVDFGFPLPAFVLERAHRLVMSLALKELKTYVED